jgi:hypothetical protein
MKIRLIIAYLLNLFDLAMTSHWVNKYGLEIEGNPIGRWLYQTGLVYPFKIVGMAFLFCLLHMAVQHRDKGTEHSFQWWDIASWVILAVYGILAIYHIFIVIKVR